MIKRIILGVLLNGLALYGVMYVMPTQLSYSGGVAFFAIGGLVMGILNAFVKPILKLITLPLRILTLGLSFILLNGFIFWIFEQVIDTLLIKGVTLDVRSVTGYIFAGLLFGLINWIEHLIIHTKK